MCQYSILLAHQCHLVSAAPSYPNYIPMQHMGISHKKDLPDVGCYLKMSLCRHASDRVFVTPELDLPIPTETLLSLRDLAHLCSVLRSVAVRWVDLGLQVGVSMDDLDVIRSNPLVLHEGIRGFLREMLRQWLQEAKRPTLEDIVEALRQDVVGEERLASGLRKEFLKLRGVTVCYPIAMALDKSTV